MGEKKERKPSGKPKAPKSNVIITDMEKVEIPMPENLGKGAKYAFLSGMNVGDCICIPPGSVNVPHDILKRSLQGAARRFGIKIVCATRPEGFCIWRKA